MSKWASDASQVNISDIERLLYRNDPIRSFLENDHLLYLSANKGLGKTLLLTYKRYRLSETAQHKGVLFLPESEPFLDMMDDVPSLSREHIEFLSKLENSDRLWSLALRVTICARYAESRHSSSRELYDERRIPARLHPWLTGRRVRPTLVVHDLLQLSVSEINRVIDEAQAELASAFSLVTSGVWIFIDKVDQAVSKLNREAWVSFQAGLIEAGARLHQLNHHARVFATIRQEAFATYTCPTKNNTRGYVMEMRYRDSELQELLDHLTRFYEKKPTFADFVGLSQVHNFYGNDRETVFHYVRRHTLGRPRDFAMIADAIPNGGSEADFRDAVNSTSSGQIVSGVFSEMIVFLEALRTAGDQSRFWTLIPSNILSNDQLAAICARFNGMPSLKEVEHSALKHPFCELFNAGLLGYIDTSSDENPVQKFKQPYDQMLPVHAGLALQSPWFLIHPGLHDLIKRHNPSYRVFRYLVVGHRYRWEPWFPALMLFQTELSRIGDDRLRSELGDLAKRYVEKRRNYPPKDSVPSRYSELRERLEAAKHPEVQLLLEDLFRW